MVSCTDKKKMKSLPPTVATLTTASIFLLASTLTLLFTFAVPYYNPPLAIDISGYGTCRGATLNVTRAWAWSQHPALLNVSAIPNDDPIFENFLGRNSIVWGSGEDLEGFTPVSWEGSVLTLDREIHLQDVCHFTLDDYVAPPLIIFAEHIEGWTPDNVAVLDP
jgi:hypothetical protein